MCRRKVAWQEDAAAATKLRETGDKRKAAKDAMWNSVAPDIRSGVTNLVHLAPQNGIVGMRGTLLELVTCEDKFFKCVEVGAFTTLLIYRVCIP